MRQIAERLVVSGVDVTVATSANPNRESDAIRNGVRVVSFAITGNWAKGMRGPVEEYRSFLLRGNFDAVLIKAAQQWTFDAAVEIVPQLKGRKLFIPCGFSGLHNPLYANYFFQMPRWLRYFDGLIFYANDFQDINFAKKHGLSSIYFLPNGVDEREFQDPNPGDIRERLDIDPKHDLLLSVGSRIAAKGHWEVIHAFRQARLSRPATLIINANAPGASFYEAAKRHIKYALTGRLPLPWLAWWYSRFQGYRRVLIVDLPRTSLVRLIKAADLFIMASHIEYSPLVLFEAAAAGTPFLATSAGNSDEIAKWTGGGRVMPRTLCGSAEVSADALAREIENMLADPNNLRSMGQRGRTSIWAGGFTWDQIVQQYHHLMIS